jgi:hypothetical protein
VRGVGSPCLREEAKEEEKEKEKEVEVEEVEVEVEEVEEEEKKEERFQRSAEFSSGCMSFVRRRLDGGQRRVELPGDVLILAELRQDLRDYCHTELPGESCNDSDQQYE